MMLRRVAVLFVTQLLLWTIASQLNHGLSGVQVYVFIAALHVAPGALLQDWRAGWLSTLLAGLLYDATTPVAFGTHLLLLAAAHVAMFHLRDRLPREDTLGQVMTVLLVNFGLFVVFALTQLARVPGPSPNWSRLLVDLAASQLLVALITPWFFALQTRALVLARVERENFA